jgi:hypothetical protein
MKRLAIALVAACSAPAARAPVQTAQPTPPTAAPAAAPTESPPMTDDERFTHYADQFLAEFLRYVPTDATGVGEHRWDGIWPDVSAAGDAKLHAFYERQLAGIPHGTLSQQNQIDATLLADRIRFGLFELDELKSGERDPLVYTRLVGEGFDPLVNRNFGTPASRLASVIGRLDGLADVLAAAKARLQHPPQVATETAIAQTAGLIDLVEHDLATRFPDGGAALSTASARASAALHDFKTFLEKDLVPSSV